MFESISTCFIKYHEFFATRRNTISERIKISEWELALAPAAAQQGHQWLQVHHWTSQDEASWNGEGAGCRECECHQEEEIIIINV